MADFRPRRTVKKALQFNLIVVGASGLGKSTFVNTLCGQNVIPQRVCDDPSQIGVHQRMQITPASVEIDEDGFKMQLTVVDTPGFGDSLDNSSNFDEILQYIERQYDDVLGEESKIKRNPKTQDARLHALLYFIAPTGHALREIDIELMKRLGRRVNVIPIIAKADSLSPRELLDFKRRIMEDIKTHAIQVFDFPYDENEDEEETIQENKELRAILPFAVVGSNEEIQVNGRLARGRRYAWGTVEVDNTKHCDYSRLRYMLFTSHIHDLKELTQNNLYEIYRSEKLSKLEGLAEKLAVLHVDSQGGDLNSSGPVGQSAAGGSNATAQGAQS